MKKIFLVFLMAIMMVSAAACAQKQNETAAEELYTVVITNDSGVKVLNAGVKNEKTGNIAYVNELENGAKATLSMLASVNAETGAPDLAVVFEFEGGDYVESVIVDSNKTSEFTITADYVPKK